MVASISSLLTLVRSFGQGLESRAPSSSEGEAGVELQESGTEGRGVAQVRGVRDSGLEPGFPVRGVLEPACRAMSKVFMQF